MTLEENIDLKITGARNDLNLLLGMEEAMSDITVGENIQKKIDLLRDEIKTLEEVRDRVSSILSLPLSQVRMAIGERRADLGLDPYSPAENLMPAR